MHSKVCFCNKILIGQMNEEDNDKKDKKKNQKFSFQEDLKTILYAFGDEKPSQDSTVECLEEY